MNGLYEKFCTTTYIHGFSDFYASNNKYVKVIWAVVIFGAFVGFVVEVSNLMMTFYDDPIVTKMAVEYGSSDLPAITICNSNKLNMTKAYDSRYNNGNATLTLLKMLTLQRNMYTVEDGIVSRYFMREMQRQNITINIESPDFSQVNIETDGFEFGYDWMEMIVGCAYLGITYTPSECFQLGQEVFDGQYGRCFYFNKFPQPQITNGYGLMLLLDLQSAHAHVSMWSPSVSGVITRIENYRDLVSASKKTLTSGGQYSKMAIMQSQYQLMKSNGKGCRDDIERQIIAGPYTYSLCVYELFLREMNRECNCVGLPSSAKVNASIRTCITHEDRACFHSKAAQLSSGELNMLKDGTMDECAPPCNYRTYQVTHSTADFPSDQLLSGLKAQNISLPLFEPNKLKDIVLLDITYDELTHPSVQQVASIDAHGFISQIGGQLGLFLGASLLSLVQALFIFAHFILDKCKSWQSSTSGKTIITPSASERTPRFLQNRSNSCGSMRSGWSNEPKLYNEDVSSYVNASKPRYF